MNRRKGGKQTLAGYYIGHDFVSGHGRFVVKTLKILFSLAFLALLAAGGWLWWFAHAPLKLGADTVEFAVAPGSSLRRAARDIARAGVDMPPRAFEIVARLAARPEEIKAGSYEVKAGATPLDLLGKLTRGEFAMTEIQFIEGWTFRQMRDALDAHPRVLHETKGLRDAAVLERLGLKLSHAEGWFFPDTYRFPRDSSDLEVLRAAYRAMEARLEAAWSRRQAELPFNTRYEALILASIVEKETGRPEDRSNVAAVFVNRLRAGMKLQADPTVIYGMGERFDGNIRKRDLLADTPYNTYARQGLPPTPIAMPGAASIEAVLNPPPIDALYFVARGDGTSEFSRTVAEHNRAVAKFQLRKR
jgi:UPF0755 protein